MILLPIVFFLLARESLSFQDNDLFNNTNDLFRHTIPLFEYYDKKNFNHYYSTKFLHNKKHQYLGNAFKY